LVSGHPLVSSQYKNERGKEGGKFFEKVIFESLNFVIHWELGEPKSPSTCLSTPSQRKKLLDLHVEPSHWLRETFILKIFCHHFWLGLMAGAQIVSYSAYCASH
jgi:hypothetical protein